MSEKTTNIGKKVLQEVILLLIVAAISALIWYFSNGWPIAGNLRKQAEQGKIAQVRITQTGDTVTVTEPETIELAAGIAQLLKVSFPGTASEGKSPETEFLFTFADGSAMQIGVSEETILKDGRQYAAGGDKSSPALFYKVTEGLFFLDRAMDEE